MNDEIALAMAAKEAVFPNLLKRLYEMRKELLEVCDKPYGSALNMTGIKKSMDAVIDQVSNCTPYEEVPDIAKLSYQRPWITRKEKAVIDKVTSKR